VLENCSPYISWYLKTYNPTAQKRYFPYEWFDSLEKLDCEELLHTENFIATLRNSNISDEEYQYCLEVWQNQNMQDFRDYLIWYNNLDVEPFVKAVEKIFEFYQEKGLDLFKDGISVPAA
jgi:hypothetical protein